MVCPLEHASNAPVQMEGRDLPAGREDRIELGAGLPYFFVWTVALDPLDPATVYAGSGSGGVYVLHQLDVVGQLWLPLALSGR